MGSRGPVPKRSDQRRRRNKSGETERVESAGRAVQPDPDGGWHPVAVRWFESLGESGQAIFYEASDWATAYLLAESISRELGSGEAPSGASLSAWLKGMSSLLVTEGDRRRMRLELEATPEVDPAEEDAVARLDDHRKRRSG